MNWRKCNSFSQLFLDDVLLQAGHECEHLALLFLRNVEFVERPDEMLRRGVPVFCDAETAV